ncbi:MAG: SprT-like domain-containing protein [Halioglobus sp.]|nr:SprT-like domain-containing protein [Halioglobus sp.]
MNPGQSTAVVQPIGSLEQRQVAQRTENFIVRAEHIFSRRFDRVPVLFDLRGRAAGMFKVIGKRRLIRYNPWIFAKYFEENLRDTVPHEVAHYIVHEVYPRRTTRPHGQAWKNLMAEFGADPGVTFDRDLDGVPQRSQRTHRYHCGCQLHEVSTTRHNRVQRRRMRYHCCSCDGLLVYSPLDRGEN